jgi:hypothetical protein
MPDSFFSFFCLLWLVSLACKVPELIWDDELFRNALVLLNWEMSPSQNGEGNVQKISDKHSYSCWSVQTAERSILSLGL